MDTRKALGRSLDELENLYGILEEQEGNLDDELYKIMENTEELIVKIKEIYYDDLF